MVKIQSESDVSKLIRADDWMMKVLRAAEKIDLPDWWISAGFLRNKIWNTIEDKKDDAATDVDLVYFNSKDTEADTDWDLSEQAKAKYPFADWEVRNQARMHYVNNFEPYSSSADAISNYVETATCVAVRLHDNKLEYLFCHGTNDLFGLIARPIPRFQTDELINMFKNRVKDKKWKQKWPNLKVKFK